MVRRYREIPFLIGWQRRQGGFAHTLEPSLLPEYEGTPLRSSCPVPLHLRLPDGPYFPGVDSPRHICRVAGFVARFEHTKPLPARLEHLQHERHLFEASLLIEGCQDSSRLRTSTHSPDFKFNEIAGWQ